MPREPDVLPFPDLRVRLAHDASVRSEGLWLAGGAPFRLMRLTDGGAGHIRRWSGSDGDVVGAELGGRALARRLLDHGLLLSDGCDPVGQVGTRLESELDVVVPVHNGSDQLERCLESLAASGVNVTVVDDGSADPRAVAEVVQRHGARLVRLGMNRGPAAARNAGLLATSRPFVGFIDSDVIISQGALTRLLGHFADPLVAAAAPRVLAAFPEQPGWMAGYENGHSALDMGPTAGNVGPERRIPYVISAAMVARRAAIGSGFAEALKSGEDVDLGWRLAAAGWRVLYDPVATVRHEHRVRLTPLLRKRWAYGRSIGPLAQRHPGALAPVRASGLTIGALGLALSGRPASGAALLLAKTFRTQRQVGGDAALTAALLGRDIRFTTIGVARAVRRAWAPALVLAALSRPYARRVLAVAALLRLAEEDHLELQYLPLALLDDLVAALALWCSCAETRVVDPLLPRIHP